MISPVLPTYARAPLSFMEGAGSWLIEAGGERYLDLGGGIAVNVLGHAHPALVAALEGQARRLWHTSNLYRVPNQEHLAELLVAATFADTVFFTNSGAEAVECAIKMARKHFSAKGAPERHRILTFEGSFHGRTIATISAAGGDKLTKGFGPLLPGFDHLPFGDMAALKAAVGPGYAELDARLAAAVHVRFGLPAVLPKPVKAQIKRADRISAWMEATRIAGFGVAEANGLFGVPKLLPGVDLRLRPPAEARADFLARHAELLAACA